MIFHFNYYENNYANMFYSLVIPVLYSKCSQFDRFVHLKTQAKNNIVYYFINNASFRT